MTNDPDIPSSSTPEPPVSEAEAARLRLLDEKLLALDARNRELDDRLRQLNERVDVLDPYHGLDWNSGSNPETETLPEPSDSPEAMVADAKPLAAMDPPPSPEPPVVLSEPPPPRNPDPGQEEDSEDDSGGEVKMALWQHLEELRWVIMKVAAGIVVCGIIGLCFSNLLQQLILAPVNSINQPRCELVWNDSWNLHAGGQMEQDVSISIDKVNTGANININNDKPTAAFMATFSIGLISGFFLALPFIVYWIWGFIAPGLKERERKAAVKAAAIGTGLFLVGCCAGYGFLYVSIPVLASFAQPGTVNIWPYPDYLWFAFMLVVAFGLVFEIPVVLVLLVRLGLVSTATLSSGRRYAIVINLIIAAVLTPTPDILNLLCMALPMMLLYEISIWVGRYYERKAARQELTEAEADE
jgi:sec-independent protein translocase protein TatC